jgi:hypothetical protein
MLIQKHEQKTKKQANKQTNKPTNKQWSNDNIVTDLLKALRNSGHVVPQQDDATVLWKRFLRVGACTCNNNNKLMNYEGIRRRQLWTIWTYSLIVSMEGLRKKTMIFGLRSEVQNWELPNMKQWYQPLHQEYRFALVIHKTCILTTFD